MKTTKNIFSVIVITFGFFLTSCTGIDQYQEPDLSAVASGLHNAGTDTTIVSGHCNIDYVPVIGTNCAGKTVIRKKPTIARYGVPTVFRTEGSSLTSDELISRFKSVGYRIVPNSDVLFSHRPSLFWDSERGFFQNLWEVIKGLFLSLIMIILLLMLWILIRWLLNYIRETNQVPPPPPANPVNNWQSENVQTFSNDLHNIVSKSVEKGHGTIVSVDSTRERTLINFKSIPPSMRKDQKETGVIKRAGEETKE